MMIYRSRIGAKRKLWLKVAQYEAVKAAKQALDLGPYPYGPRVYREEWGVKGELG